MAHCELREQENEQSNYQMICEEGVMEMTTDLQKQLS